MIYFFGYGVYRDRQRLEDILRKEPKGGYGAMLSDYILASQNLNLLPEKPKKTIQSVWGDAFKAYTLKKGVGLVAGIVWELEDQDLQVLKDWEYDGIWREFKEVHVVTYDKRTISAITEKAFDDAPISEIFDGLHYDDNLNKGKKRIPDEDEYKISLTRKLLKNLIKV